MFYLEITYHNSKAVSCKEVLEPFQQACYNLETLTSTPSSYPVNCVQRMYVRQILRNRREGERKKKKKPRKIPNASILDSFLAALDVSVVARVLDMHVFLPQ